MQRLGRPPVRATTARRRALTFSGQWRSRDAARGGPGLRRSRAATEPLAAFALSVVSRRVRRRSRSRLRRRRSSSDLRFARPRADRLRPAPISQRNPRCCRHCAALPRSSSKLASTAAGASVAACGRSRLRTAARAIDRSHPTRTVMTRILAIAAVAAFAARKRRIGARLSTANAAHRPSVCPRDASRSALRRRFPERRKQGRPDRSAAHRIDAGGRHRRAASNGDGRRRDAHARGRGSGRQARRPAGAAARRLIT